MYPVSQDFHNQMKAQTRRIYGKIQVDYTDPFLDQSIQVSANENANYSYPEQTADSTQEPYGKIASLDGSWVLDGTYVLAPTPEEAEELQMGWWGSQLSDENGNYTALQIEEHEFTAEWNQGTLTDVVVVDGGLELELENGYLPKGYRTQQYNLSPISTVNDSVITWKGENSLSVKNTNTELTISNNQGEVEGAPNFVFSYDSNSDTYNKLVVFQYGNDADYSGSRQIKIKNIDTGEENIVAGQLSDGVNFRYPRAEQMHNGNLICAFDDLENKNILYAISNNPEGTSWNSYQTLIQNAERPNLLITNNGHIYCFYRSSVNNSVHFIKSEDNGLTWSSPSTVLENTINPITYISGCQTDDGDLVVAITISYEIREYRSIDGGNNWEEIGSITTKQFSNYDFYAHGYLINVPNKGLVCSCYIDKEDRTAYLATFIKRYGENSWTENHHFKNELNSTFADGSIEYFEQDKKLYFAYHTNKYDSKYDALYNILEIKDNIIIETNLSLDNGQTWQGWKQCTNGGSIPDITVGMDLSNAILDTRQTLSTNDTTVTPRLENLKFVIENRYTLHPTLIVTFAPRPIHRLQVIADNKRKEWPVNFEINLYSNETLLYTENVTDNTEIFWSTDIERVNEITKMELIITKWSHVNRQVKILEFFTSIQETYETDDILLINLLEEREVSQGSLPVGNISSNEIDIRLVNENGRFDAGNRQSPLYQLLKPNRRIKAWLGTYIDYDIVPTEFLVDTDTEWNQGTLTDVVAVDGGLELWQPEYYANFDNNVNLTKNDGTTIGPESGAVYTLRPNEGKFGGAVAVEEGTVNLVNNPTEWIVNTNQHQETVDTGEKFLGCRVSKTTKLLTGTPSTQIGEILSIADGEVYTASVYVKITQKGNLDGARLIFYDYNNSRYLAQTFSSKVGEWERLEVTYANNTGSTLDGVRVLYYPSRDVGDITYTAAPQLEQKPFATSFVDGSRADGKLQYPVSLSQTEGTICGWFLVDRHKLVNSTSSAQDLFVVRRGAGNPLENWFQYTFRRNRLVLQYRNRNATVVRNNDVAYTDNIDDGWHQFGIRWYGDTVDAFMDGVLLGSVQYDADELDPFDTLQVGSRDNSNAYNSLIDELLILPYAATEEEIARWYDQSLPLQRSERGNRTQQYNLSHIATVNDSVISWQETLNGQSIIIETNLSIDGGSTWLGWKECTNGGSIPDVTAGMDLSDAILDTRVTLSTNDTTVTPRLEHLKITINGIEYFPEPELKYIPLGTFWSGDWTAPEGEIYAQTTGRDRLELLNQSTYSNSQVRQNVTLYDLAIDVLEDYGLKPEDYFVDEELQNIVIPYAYFTPQSHREALRKIAEASLGQCYCDRDGLVRLEGYSYLQSKTEPDIVITRDDYFMKDNPYNYMQIANYIEVETQPLRPAPTEEVYRSNEPVGISAGETISITAYYNVEPCIEPVASVEGTGTISDVTYYSWGADVKVTSNVAGAFELVINAKPLKIQGAEKVVAKDDDSIRENGRIKYTFPKNPLVQTRQQAQKIADNLLAYFKDPRRDLTIEWRGNPALLLGDRIQVVDEYGREDFFITVQNIEYDGGLRVSIEGRKADGVERY